MPRGGTSRPATIRPLCRSSGGCRTVTETRPALARTAAGRVLPAAGPRPGGPVRREAGRVGPGGADLRRAFLPEAGLVECNLIGTDLAGADLSTPSFVGPSPAGPPAWPVRTAGPTWRARNWRTPGCTRRTCTAPWASRRGSSSPRKGTLLHGSLPTCGGPPVGTLPPAGCPVEGRRRRGRGLAGARASADQGGARFQVTSVTKRASTV